MRSTLAEKIMHRVAIVCGALFMIFLMTGCSAGSTIDTTLVINGDLSGTRQMNITISDSVFQEYFTGNIEDFNALMDGACPEGMTWNYSEENGVKQYDMEIAFSSPEDYKTKVENILGVESVDLTIAAPDTVWASGISVEESFNDKQLLKWMEDLLVNNGFVSSSNADMIFSVGTVCVVYGNETYSTGSMISVSQVDYVSVDAIHILTQINELGNYGRRVVVQIPASSMEKKGDEIKAYMDSVVPKGAKGEWSEGDGCTLFTVSADSLTAEQLEAFNRSVFDSENCSVTAADMSENSAPFTFDELLTEHIDLTGYLAGNYSSIRVAYAIKKADSYYAYESRDGISKGYTGQPWEQYSGYDLYSDSYYYDSFVDFSTLIQKAYRVKELEVKTDRTLGGDWKRTLTFSLEKTPDEEEQAAMTEALEVRAGIAGAEEQPAESESAAGAETGTETDAEEPEKKADVKVSDKTSDDVYSVTITQKGSGEELEESSRLLFDVKTSVFYACDREFWKVKKQEAFTETLSFGNMLEYVTDDFQVNYTAKLGLFADMQYCTADSAEVKGGKLHATFSNNRVNITYVGSKIDVIAILFWIFLAVGVISLLVLLVKLGVFRKKEKPAAPAEASVVNTETAPAEQSTVKEEAAEAKEEKTVSKFCEKCGTPRPEGAKFCEKCGSKFED